MTTLRVDAVCAKASIQIPMKSDEAPRTKSASAASNIGVESFLGLDAVRSIVRYSVGKLIIVFICGLLGLKLKGVTEISTIRSPIVAIGKLSNVPDLFVQRQQCLVAWATAVYSGKRDFELISATSRVSNLHGKVDGWHGLHKDPYEDPDGIVEAARAKTASVASSFLTRVLHSTGCSALEVGSVLGKISLAVIRHLPDLKFGSYRLKICRYDTLSPSFRFQAILDSQSSSTRSRQNGPGQAAC